MSSYKPENKMGGYHFTLGNDLRIKNSQTNNFTPVANNSGLRNLANSKHLATYSQPVQGPLTLETYQQMAKQVHATRPGMPSDLNTVGIFHEKSLQRAQNTGTGMKLSAMGGTVMTSQKSSGSVKYEPAKEMTFGTFGQKHHFTGLKK
jgi:hypothetical protein